MFVQVKEIVYFDNLIIPKDFIVEILDEDLFLFVLCISFLLKISMANFLFALQMVIF